MSPIIALLHRAQKVLLSQKPGSAQHAATLQELKTIVPAPVLAHYLRLIDQRRPGVALLRHDVCSCCHLRVPSGLAATMITSEDVHLCENCGTYLMLPEEEPSAPAAAARPVRRKRKQPETVTA